MKRTLEMMQRMQSEGVIGAYALGGAVGATCYLEPAATVDVDVFVTLPAAPGSSLPSLAPIDDYLTARGCKVRDEYIVIGDWPVRFLAPADALENEALAEAVEVYVEGVRTRVMTAEHLAAIALNTGRAKDFSRVLQFLEQDVVDAEKLHRILVKHGLSAKWEKFRQRYLDE
jgi:hypothetical protein